MTNYQSAGVAALSIILVGCVTPQELRSQGPYLEQSSGKAADEILACVTKLWDEQGVRYSYAPRPGGGSLTVRTREFTSMVVDVEPTGDARRVRFYLSRAVFPKVNERRRAEIAACV